VIGPASSWRDAQGAKEYLIFDALRACDHERKTQALNE
jgi:hypothetical protein